MVAATRLAQSASPLDNLGWSQATISPPPVRQLAALAGYRHTLGCGWKLHGLIAAAVQGIPCKEAISGGI